jgi:hypothetical protein
MDCDYQTRSDINGIEFYPYLEDALDAFKNDKTIWKISFSTGNKNYRLKPKYAIHEWSDELELKLNNLNLNYASHKNEKVQNKISDKYLFFVNQKITVSKYLSNIYYTYLNNIENNLHIDTKIITKYIIPVLVEFKKLNGKFLSYHHSSQLNNFINSNNPSLEMLSKELINLIFDLDTIDAIYSLNDIYKIIDN